MFRIITILFVIGILFRLISRYVIPIFRITSMTGDRLRQMQDQMREMDRKVNQNQPRNNVKKEGDYIDYEEVR